MAPTQLEIKVKALQRLVKEEQFYQDELAQQYAHVQQLEADSSVDPYDLKKQHEVLQDTQRLLPVLYDKISQFKVDLEQYLSHYEGVEPVDEAHTVIKNADGLLNSASA